MIRAAIPILMYHQVCWQAPASFQKYVVSPRAFARQMRWLARRGYQSMTLDALLERRHSPAARPQRVVVITFDDGFYDCMVHALPVLRAHGFSAIFYLVAGLMGQQSEWLRPSHGFTHRLMGWDDARTLLAEGMACGAHTMTHPRLADVSAHQCRAELAASRQQLEAQLGQSILHLAYPYGSWNPQVQTIAEQCGYRSGCTTQQGFSYTDEHPLALRRIIVSGTDTLLDFVSRLQTARSVRELIRDARIRMRQVSKQAAQ